MAMPQDAVGHFINFMVPRGGQPVVGGPANTVNGVLIGQTAVVNAAVWDPGAAWVAAAPRVPAPVPGAWVRARPGGGPVPGGGPALGGAPPAPASYHRTGASWNFTFLNYCPGDVTVAPVGAGVLTGPLSGCYVFRYTEGGVSKVAHVGTADTQADARSIKAKNDWMQFTALPGVTNIVGGSAFDMFTHSEVAAAVIGSPYDVPICCYVTATDAWAVLFAKASDASRPPPGGLMKVVASKRMALQRWEDVSKLRIFSGPAPSALAGSGIIKLS